MAAGMAPAVLALLCGVAGAARAMPGAMPWDHAGGPGRPDCTACHFDRPAVEPSAALRLSGLPENIVPGKAYDLRLRLKADGLVTAGFLLRAESGRAGEEGTGSGAFLPADGRAEAKDGAIRSTEAGARQKSSGAAEWRFSWRAPDDLAETLTFYLAAVAGNDDESPLGDRVHLRQIERTVAAERN